MIWWWWRRNKLFINWMVGLWKLLGWFLIYLGHWVMRRCRVWVKVLLVVIVVKICTRLDRFDINWCLYLLFSITINDTISLMTIHIIIINIFNIHHYNIFFSTFILLFIILDFIFIFLMHYIQLFFSLL